MYQFYSILKDRDDPATPEEVDIASARRKLDWKAEAEYMQKLEKSSENIKKAFQNQQARTIVSEVPSLVFACNLRFMTGAMGSGEVRASTYGMGHRV
jgi:acetyl-CoA carboxylase beta subunit